MLVDPAGNPIQSERPKSALCPICSAPARQKEIITAFGSWWRQVCSNCGHEYRKGQGLPPLEE